MEKMKMQSPNITQENIARIHEMFPGCVTEAQDKDGKVKLSVDFDQLRQELSESIVEGQQERYHLNWPGKREALFTANAPIAKTLRPSRKESVDFDTTKNLFIEGDNLDALKLLQETYLGKVKMIYIDPPYNTGNDFIYDDDFAENTDEFLKRSNQKDDEGNNLIANKEANGRFHSDWLSMIYPRLKLAFNLLSDDGVIFISMDENEISNLRKLCDEIFGEKNSLSTFIWSLPRGINAGHISRAHEYVVCYCRDKSKLPLFNKIGNSEFSIDRCNKKIDRRHPASEITFPAGIKYNGNDKTLVGAIEGSERIDIIGELEFKDGTLQKEVTLRAGWTMRNMILDWLDGKKVFDIKEQEIVEFFFKENGKLYSKKRIAFETPKSIITDAQDTQYARIQLEDLLGSQDIFPYPKPTALIENLIKRATGPTDIILDFFGGSCATAHAVMSANATSGTNRQFIMIQIDELIDKNNPDSNAAINFCETNRFEPNIAEIGKERIRRAGKKILESKCHEGWNKDIGFRVLKIDSSNMADVYYTPDAVEQGLLKIFTDNIKPDRKPEDLLFQVLLDWGVDLSLPIRKEAIHGKSVFFVDENALVACFDSDVNEELVKELAGFEPLRVVFRDNGFVSDAVKINVEQIFKQMSPSTDVKSI